MRVAQERQVLHLKKEEKLTKIVLQVQKKYTVQDAVTQKIFTRKFNKKTSGKFSRAWSNFVLFSVPLLVTHTTKSRRAPPPPKDNLIPPQTLYRTSVRLVTIVRFESAERDTPPSRLQTDHTPPPLKCKRQKVTTFFCLSGRKGGGIKSCCVAACPTRMLVIRPRLYRWNFATV